ncbi:MAG: YgfZ/GcvT domain-containing protein [Bosea sp. (in: a-proteobacteria)]
MRAALLPERFLIRIAGEDATHFLHNLLTCDVEAIQPEAAGFGALLTPQGKIIADMFVVGVPAADGGGYILDVNAGPAPALMQKLKLYRLRARVEISDISADAHVLVVWGDDDFEEEEALVYVDPRLTALGRRAIVPADTAPALINSTASDYHAHRIQLGVPDGGKDFAYGDAFPHEALMDQLHGVSFTKGCYIGQEVVSRMQHKGTGRTRIIPVRFPEGIAPDWGVPAMWGDLPLGQIGSSANARGLAMLRLDRLADCLAAGSAPTGGGLPFRPERESWMSFEVPGV